MDKEAFVAAVREVEGQDFAREIAFARGVGYFTIGNSRVNLPVYTANADPKETASFTRTVLDVDDIGIDMWGQHFTAGGFEITTQTGDGGVTKINGKEARKIKP